MRVVPGPDVDPCGCIEGEFVRAGRGGEFAWHIRVLPAIHSIPYHFERQEQNGKSQHTWHIFFYESFLDADSAWLRAVEVLMYKVFGWRYDLRKGKA